MRSLLRADGSIDRRALLRDAHREWNYARQKGWDQPGDDIWTWDRCLALSQARARRERELRAIEIIGAAVREMVG
jgi:hypothetical protein